MIVEQIQSLKTPLPADYVERVYAGVLGKIIGVYLGRPVENWSYERIEERFGEIRYYIHEQLGRRLIITDDDISGTFVFLRSLRDHDLDPNLTLEQIGETWLNYLIEKTTILWWGGLGNSTEHTAYLRLKSGIKAPESGSIACNTKVIAEQIGAQIFIDGWGLVNPGDPDRAADFARRAASVSHDGEAIYGAQVVASLVAHGFVESDLNRLLDQAVTYIPAESDIRRLIDSLRDWHAGEKDWRTNHRRLKENFGYDKFIGNCHMVPNHGAIILSILHGSGDFHESLHIVNTLGWDTDCNSGNVGCILGVRNGLDGIMDGPDWRGPVADRIFLPCANPGLAITDAARVTIEVANVGRQLHGQAPIVPKGGARFHFDLPGAVQGFRVDPAFESRHVLTLENTERALDFRFKNLAPGTTARAFTDTFIPLETRDLVTGYVLVASPTLHPGQTVSARLIAGDDNSGPVEARLYLRHYDASDDLVGIRGSAAHLEPGAASILEWTVPETGSQPIAEIGLELTSRKKADGHVRMDWLRWDGVPATKIVPAAGTMWARAWGKALDRFESARDGFMHLAQDRGRGLLILGSDEWQDIAVESKVWAQMAREFGIATRVQGLRRHYSLTLRNDRRLVLSKTFGEPVTLAETAFDWTEYQPYVLRLEVSGSGLRGYVDGELRLEAADASASFAWGGAAFVVEEGCMGSEGMQLGPV